uniref:Replication protein E1 n=1 Tax=Lygus hesperus TaxID=30085 RepID=A0A0A9WW46_LYGHE
MRRLCKRTARRWLLHLQQEYPEYAAVIKLLDQYDSYKLSSFRPSRRFLRSNSSIDVACNTTVDVSELSTPIEDIPSASDSDVTPSSESDGLSTDVQYDTDISVSGGV